MKKLRIGFDSYCLSSKNMMPDEVIKWASENGAEGVSFSGYKDETRELFTSSYLRDVKQMADELGFYLEWGCGQHIPLDTVSFKPKEILLSNRKAIGEAYGLGVNIIRSRSDGLIRWNKDSPSTEIILKATAKELQKQSSMFRDNGITLAIETQLDFTTFELLRLFEMCETEPGDYLGICLDPMNLITMLEDPLTATDRILPWIVSSQIKDGAILLDEAGMTTFPVPIGKGVIDLEAIINRLVSEDRDIPLSVKDHGGSHVLPINESWFIERFPDLSFKEYDSLLEMTGFSLEKKLNSDLRVTDPGDWPLICEERTKENILNIKLLRDRLSAEEPKEPED
jgi:sugar phosphate isomerase/epimerase